jgi:hypothetical protein
MSAPIRGGVKVFIGGRVFTVGSEAEAAELTEMMTGKPVMRRGSGGNGLATAAGAAVTIASLFTAFNMQDDAREIRDLRAEKNRRDLRFCEALKAVKPELATLYAECQDKQDEIDRQQQESFASAIDFAFIIAGAGGVMLAVGGQKMSWDDFTQNYQSLNLAEVAIVGGFSGWVISTYADSDRDRDRDDDRRRGRRRSLRDQVAKLG